jgi:hypothetical protein
MVALVPPWSLDQPSADEPGLRAIASRIRSTSGEDDLAGRG